MIRRLEFGFISLSHTISMKQWHPLWTEKANTGQRISYFANRLRNMTVMFLVKLRKAQLRFSIKIEFFAVEERRSFIIFQTRDKHVEESGSLWEIFGLKKWKGLGGLIRSGDEGKGKRWKVLLLAGVTGGLGRGGGGTNIASDQTENEKEQF